MNVQWLEIPFALESPVGSGEDALPFNAFLSAANPLTHLSDVTGPQWILQSEACNIGAAKRIARDNNPQKSGEIIHKKYKSGVTVVVSALAVNVTSPQSSGDVVFVPACDEDLVDLVDLMMRHLQAIENSDGRLTWLPTGKLARMVNSARWLGSSGDGGSSFTSVDLEKEDNNVFTAATFALLSPFPYGMDAADTTTALADGVTQVLANSGTGPFYPVVRVKGPTSAFNITVVQELTGETFNLFYDASLPDAQAIAGGQEIEFDFFRETAYFGATGGPFTGDNAKPGIDVQNSDFWTMEVGNNTIGVFGADADLIWQPAYAG